MRFDGCCSSVLVADLAPPNSKPTLACLVFATRTGAAVSHRSFVRSTWDQSVRDYSVLLARPNFLRNVT